MKNFFSKASLMVIAMLSSMFLFSCGENETPEAPERYETLLSEYQVHLSDGYLTFYDAKVIYGYGDDKVITENIETNDWSYNNAIKVSSIKLPADFFCKVILTQKKDIPAITPDHNYELKFSYDASLTGITTNKKEKVLRFSKNEGTINKSLLQQYLDSHKEVTIMEFYHTAVEQ